jgi:hypothetical protein
MSEIEKLLAAYQRQVREITHYEQVRDHDLLAFTKRKPKIVHQIMPCLEPAEA